MILLMQKAYGAITQEELDIAKAKTLIDQEHYYECHRDIRTFA